MIKYEFKWWLRFAKRLKLPWDCRWNDSLDELIEAIEEYNKEKEREYSLTG